MNGLITDSKLVHNLLTFCADLFDRSERFSLADKVIASAIKKFEGNDSIHTVLPKVMLINSFYATQIYDTEKIARHILNADADRRLSSGDLSLVYDIRRGHGIKVKKTDRERDFYSFTTKYVALHEPTKFPIFDSLVMRLITTLNKQLSFCPQFTQIDLRDYQRYVSVIEALLKFAGLESFKYKLLDQGLWVYAKYLYGQSNFTEIEAHLIKAAAQQIVR